MSEITIKEITNEQEWEGFLATRPESSFLQSWYWGEFQKNIGHKISRVGLYSRNVLIGVMLAITENAKRGKYITVPGGPIIDWSDKAVVDICLKDISQQAKNQDCSFVRIRPQIEQTDEVISYFSSLGFITAPMHLGAEQTHQLDITLSEETLFAQMRKSTRYEIKKAEKTNITISSSRNPADIRTFYDLQLETARRQNFVPFSYDFLHEQFKIFARQNKAILYSAYQGEMLLAQAFIIFYGNEAVYHYGGSTLAGRKYPGAYAIQWEAIKEAKRRGCTRYNFWGVADDPTHRYYSLSIFKRGFGGYDFTYLHAQDLVVNSWLYSINFAIEHVRKKMRKL